MATINVTLPSDGETADVADYNTPINAIVNEFNGNIDNNNIKSAAAISGSKLANNSINLESKASVDSGWREVTDSWAYASYDSTNKTGVITVPSDATTTYSAGMRVRFSQATDGVKYGIITKVAATALTVYLGTDYDLDNESISSTYYSVHKAPYGFPLNPAKWTVTASSSSDRSISATSYGSLTDTIGVPIGLWRLHMRATFGKGTAASTTNDLYHITLSSDGSTETNTNLTAFANFRFGASGASSSGAITSSTEDFVSVTAATTFTLLGKKNSGADNGLVGGSSFHPTVFRAICAYL